MLIKLVNVMLKIKPTASNAEIEAIVKESINIFINDIVEFDRTNNIKSRSNGTTNG